MSTNTNLHNARKARNDEYYTKWEDVVAGLEPYREYFKGKRVLCPCDHYLDSEFYKYFKENYHMLGLAGLVATSLSGVRAEYNGVEERTIHVIEIPFQLSTREEEYDVTVTNPPFSIIKEYYNCVKYKDCIFVGTVMHLKYKGIVEDFLAGDLYVGYNKGSMSFSTPEGDKKVANVLFMGTVKPTNPHYKEPKPSTNTDPIFYNVDGTEIMNVDSSRDIPKGYSGLMAVPLSYITFYNPEKYKIVDLLRQPTVNGVKKFDRWVIKEV